MANRDWINYQPEGAKHNGYGFWGIVFNAACWFLVGAILPVLIILGLGK